MSFAMHKQVHPPTGVDHVRAAYFNDPIGDGGPPNLVVTQANHPTVFAIRRESGRDDATSPPPRSACQGWRPVGQGREGGGGRRRGSHRRERAK